jgi:hypothetical protein
MRSDAIPEARGHGPVRDRGIRASDVAVRVVAPRALLARVPTRLLGLRPRYCFTAFLSAAPALNFGTRVAAM